MSTNQLEEEPWFHLELFLTRRAMSNPSLTDHSRPLHPFITPFHDLSPAHPTLLLPPHRSLVRYTNVARANPRRARYAQRAYVPVAAASATYSTDTIRRECRGGDDSVSGASHSGQGQGERVIFDSMGGCTVVRWTSICSCGLYFPRGHDQI